MAAYFEFEPADLEWVALVGPKDVNPQGTQSGRLK